MSKKKRNESGSEVEKLETVNESTKLENSDTEETVESAETDLGSETTEQPETYYEPTFTEVKTMISLYNRNNYPVTLLLSDNSELVLSPQQKTEPMEASLVVELPSGVVQMQAN